MQLFLDKLQHKLEIAKKDSDFTYFFALLVTGEAITKLVTLLAASSLDPSRDRHQYRILHGLVRASGVGDWSLALDDLLIGAASQYLAIEFREFQAEITRKVSKDEWQYIAGQQMIAALHESNIDTEPPSSKADLKSWFKNFTVLRNKTRGHGALLPDRASRAAPHLEKSIGLILENLQLLRQPVAYLKRNLSGKYRVTEIGPQSEVFDDFKTSSTLSLEDGIYLYLGTPKKVPLILSDPDLTDFYISNGGFTNKKYELLSYISDDKKLGNSSEFLSPVGVLPSSDSEGLGELRCEENAFTNAPDLSYEYIDRPELEDQLHSVLMDDRRTVVTLLGRGGIGKTSLALRVIPRLYATSRFDAIIWFSSRDIDLLSSGAKLVTADVVTARDMSKYYSSLVLSQEKTSQKGFKPVQYFQNQLTESEIGPCLFVFDNFETTENPIEIFGWIDTYIRNPNKVLITTRLREFVGDYPINVHGMTESESEELTRLTARQLGVESYLTENKIEEIYRVSAGHPYIIKIMLGELSKNQMKGSLPKIIAGSEEVLTALFERTYSALNPCAQRVFLTLASWTSSVPRLALESILMMSMDDPLEVERAIDTLVQYSLVEEFQSVLDGQYFIVLPFAAASFGKRKLRVSPLKSSIYADVKVLQKFGAEKVENKKVSLLQHVSKFLATLDNPLKDYAMYHPLFERIGTSYVDAWPIISRWMEETGEQNLLEKAADYLYLFLENEPQESQKVAAWNQLAGISRERHLPLEEVHALIEASLYAEIEFSDLSNVVNKVNRMLSKHELVLDNRDVKSELLTKLYEVVWKRRLESDPGDFSRLAWLALHLQRIEDAKILVQQGLNIDPDNRHCLSLQERLDKSGF